MGKRLVKWSTYSIAFALLPLGISILVRALAEQPHELTSNAAELLFFALMVNATALGDSHDLSQIPEPDLTIRVFRSSLLLGAITSAILYGVNVSSSLSASTKSSFPLRLFIVSLVLAVLSFILATAAEILLSRVEDTK
jgi:hypothetical protein